MDARLFIAIEIADTVKKKLTEFQNYLRKTAADVKWVAPENLHITLKFIGYMAEEKIGEVEQAITDSVRHIKPFHLYYTGVDAFPAGKNPRVIFARAEDTQGVLEKIHKKLNEQLVALGIEQDGRKFDAHVTVGRVKSRRNIEKFIHRMNSYGKSDFGDEKITRLVLMQSTLSPNGPTYRIRKGICFTP